MQCKHSAWIYFALWMFQESLNIHYLRGSHVRAAAAGVQQKVHGVLIAPYGRQLYSSQDKARPCKFMHNGTQQPSSRCPWVPCCWCYRCLFTAGWNFDFLQVGFCLWSPFQACVHQADKHPHSELHNSKADISYFDISLVPVGAFCFCLPLLRF